MRIELQLSAVELEALAELATDLGVDDWREDPALERVVRHAAGRRLSERLRRADPTLSVTAAEVMASRMVGLAADTLRRRRLRLTRPAS